MGLPPDIEASPRTHEPGQGRAGLFFAGKAHLTQGPQVKHGWRRRGTGRRKLLPLLRAPDPDAAPDGTAVIDLRDSLARLLSQLPPRQRAVIVLRYWEQRTEAETAVLLGCSEGTVKSAAARGLRRPRERAVPRRIAK